MRTGGCHKHWVCCLSPLIKSHKKYIDNTYIVSKWIKSNIYWVLWEVSLSQCCANYAQWESLPDFGIRTGKILGCRVTKVYDTEIGDENLRVESIHNEWDSHGRTFNAINTGIAGYLLKPRTWLHAYCCYKTKNDC